MSDRSWKRSTATSSKFSGPMSGGHTRIRAPLMFLGCCLHALCGARKYKGRGFGGVGSQEQFFGFACFHQFGYACDRIVLPGAAGAPSAAVRFLLPATCSQFVAPLPRLSSEIGHLAVGRRLAILARASHLCRSSIAKVPAASSSLFRVCQARLEELRRVCDMLRQKPSRSWLRIGSRQKKAKAASTRVSAQCLKPRLVRNDAV